MSEIEIAGLSMADAHELAPRIAAYAQERKRGAPRSPDEYYAELLLEDRTAEILGAWSAGRLVGFAIFFDLPDTITGMRVGQVDDLFVIQDARGRGAGKALVDALAAEGAKRGWTELRWVVPDKPPEARRLAAKLAERSPRTSYVIRIERAGD
jgi:GNAT superfamily N-acetyltransferase